MSRIKNSISVVSKTTFALFIFLLSWGPDVEPRDGAMTTAEGLIKNKAEATQLLGKRRRLQDKNRSVVPAGSVARRVINPKSDETEALPSSFQRDLLIGEFARELEKERLEDEAEDNAVMESMLPHFEADALKKKEEEEKQKKEEEETNQKPPTTADLLDLVSARESSEHCLKEYIVGHRRILEAVLQMYYEEVKATEF